MCAQVEILINSFKFVGGRDYGVTGVQGNAFGDVNGRNKGHQVAGFSTSYNKNENGNKATYYDDGLGHGGVTQYGLRDQRYRTYEVFVSLVCFRD